MSDLGVPTEIDDLSRSSRSVYFFLASIDEWVPSQTVAIATDYAFPTAKSALEDLHDRDLVERRPRPNEPRGVEYRVKTQDGGLNHSNTSVYE